MIFYDSNSESTKRRDPGIQDPEEGLESEEGLSLGGLWGILKGKSESHKGLRVRLSGLQATSENIEQLFNTNDVLLGSFRG